jgi:hypothetical protein
MGKLHCFSPVFVVQRKKYFRCSRKVGMSPASAIEEKTAPGLLKRHNSFPVFLSSD